MSILIAIIVGGIIGWLAGLIAGRDNGLVGNVVIGMLGAVLGGFLARMLGSSTVSYMTFTWAGFFWSLGGAVLLTLAINAMQGRSRNNV